MGSLKWDTAGTVNQGNLQALINRSLLENGNVFHSIQVIRNPKNGKPSKFYRVEDLEDLEKIAQGIRFWIQADIDEIRKGLKTA